MGAPEVSSDGSLAPDVPLAHSVSVGIPEIALFGRWPCSVTVVGRGSAPEVPIAHNDCMSVPEVSSDGRFAPDVPLTHSVGVGVPEMPCSDGTWCRKFC
ncbi:hypothetical protein DPMN_094956 [Dreissena polymorpha]|uniref:Uncharacterized protein n=1 Tax=Dreissena polymorpha TaxID=45954 RepID=A0A9D4L8J6_DREPO|nr:hypothetical protein DPMN_094956 [Dreissena polymorpha]